MAERLVVEDGWLPLAGSYEEAVLTWHAQWERVFSRRVARERDEGVRDERRARGSDGDSKHAAG